MVASKASTQLSKIAQSWPLDPFRPNLQLRTFLQALSAHPQLTPQAVEAVEAIRNNVLQNKYILSEKMLKPPSKPLHYEQVVEGVQKSAQGIPRPWWKRFFGIW